MTARGSTGLDNASLIRTAEMKTFNQIFQATDKAFNADVEDATYADRTLELNVGCLFLPSEGETRTEESVENEALRDLMLKIDIRHTLWERASGISIALAKCQSPIEKMMLVALYGAISEGISGVGQVEFVHSPAVLRSFFWDRSRLQICPQWSVGKYTADFMLSYEDRSLNLDGTPREMAPPGDKNFFMKRLIVECDGHDYHERTKEQAQHDKARDRFFVAQGHIVYRFTGSEIWKDSFKCAREALREVTCTNELGRYVGQSEPNESGSA